MRIGNGPRLVVPRPGRHFRWGWYGRRADRGQAYDEWRASERLRIARRPHWTIANWKGSSVFTAGFLERTDPCSHFRRVDDHGRSYGPRLTTPSGLPPATRVRRVLRQEEDLHSLMSRMMTRAHRASA